MLQDVSAGFRVIESAYDDFRNRRLATFDDEPIQTGVEFVGHQGNREFADVVQESDEERLRRIGLARQDGDLLGHLGSFDRMFPDASQARGRVERLYRARYQNSPRILDPDVADRLRDR